VVVALFSLQDVNGQLSPALGRLYRLKRLDLGGAVGLTGSIEALRNAALLQELNLSHCQVPRYDVAVWNRVFFSLNNYNSTCYNKQHAISLYQLYHVMIFEFLNLTCCR